MYHSLLNVSKILQNQSWSFFFLQTQQFKTTHRAFMYIVYMLNALQLRIKSNSTEEAEKPKIASSHSMYMYVMANH